MSWRLASCDWLESAAVSELSVAPCAFVCAPVRARLCIRVLVCVSVCVLRGYSMPIFGRKRSEEAHNKNLTEREQCRGSEEEAENETKILRRSGWFPSFKRCLTSA